MQGPVQESDRADASAVEPVEVAFEELSIGENSAAIERIEQNTDLDRDDPARLINLGIAHARRGYDIQARDMFAAAAKHEDRYQLETAEGDWGRLKGSGPPRAGDAGTGRIPHQWARGFQISPFTRRITDRNCTQIKLVSKSWPV